MAVAMASRHADDSELRADLKKARAEVIQRRWDKWKGKAIASTTTRRSERPAAYVRSELYDDIKNSRVEVTRKAWNKRTLRRRNAAAAIRAAVSELFNKQFKPDLNLTEQWLEGQELDEKIREALRRAIECYMLGYPGRTPNSKMQAREAKRILDEQGIKSKKVRIGDRVRQIALDKEFKSFVRGVGKTYPRKNK
jgi:hypothetical protein